MKLITLVVLFKIAVQLFKYFKFITGLRFPKVYLKIYIKTVCIFILHIHFANKCILRNPYYNVILHYLDSF